MGSRSNSDEQALERLAQVFADDALDVLVGERAHVVLEAAQLGDDVGRQHVRPHRQELAELDERRPELVEHFPQVLAALGRRALDERRTATARQEVGQAVPFEEVAEAVPDGDLCDLRQTSEVACALGRLGHDLQCSTRKGRPLVRRVRDCPGAAFEQAYPMLQLRDAELELLVVPARDDARAAGRAHRARRRSAPPLGRLRPSSAASALRSSVEPRPCACRPARPARRPGRPRARPSAQRRRARRGRASRPNRAGTAIAGHAGASVAAGGAAHAAGASSCRRAVAVSVSVAGETGRSAATGASSGTGGGSAIWAASASARITCARPCPRRADPFGARTRARAPSTSRAAAPR